MTKHEATIQDIERRMSRPGKGDKVTSAEVQFVNVEREKERARIARTKALGPEIKIQWVDGEPKKWEDAQAIVSFGDKDRILNIEAREQHEGKERLKPALVNKGYQKLVEEWAMWKWHTARGSELDEVGNPILDCDAPAFVWLPSEKPVRRRKNEPEAA